MTSVHQWSSKSLSKQISGETPKEGGLSKTETKDTSVREERVDIGTPKQNMIHLFQTKHYKPSIEQHKAFIRELCEHPVEMYAEMRSRLIEKGETVCFEREFSGAIGYLTRYLFQTFLKDKITAGKQYEIIGFAQCPHFVKTCAAFQKAGIAFMPIIVKGVEELTSKVEEQCDAFTIKGEAGDTSPQVLKKSEKTVVCLGGHDNVVWHKCAEWFAEQTVLRDQLIPALVGIQIETRHMYPYRATLDVIQRMLAIIDQYHHTQIDVEFKNHNFRLNMPLRWLIDNMVHPG